MHTWLKRCGDLVNTWDAENRYKTFAEASVVCRFAVMQEQATAIWVISMLRLERTGSNQCSLIHLDAVRTARQMVSYPILCYCRAFLVSLRILTYVGLSPYLLRLLLSLHIFLLLCSDWCVMALWHTHSLRLSSPRTTHRKFLAFIATQNIAYSVCYRPIECRIWFHLIEINVTRLSC